jgi:hypothetical protein
MLFPNGAAHAADTCLTAPNSPAPQGSHWYYRLERPSLRKCWRLVQKDRKEQSAATQTAPQPADATAAAPPPAASIPPARMALPDVRPTLEPLVRNLVTRNVSSPSEPAQPLPPPEPPAAAMPRGESAPAAQDQAMPAEPALAANAQQPVAAGDAPAAAAEADGAPTLTLLLGAIALLGLFAGALFLVLAMVRRRTDVLNTVQDADTLPREAMPEDVTADEVPVPADEVPVADAPTFAPLPPMAEVPREDDVDVALRRFRENMRRRAA